VVETFTPRSRKVKILATLGPASSDPAMIRKLVLAGAEPPEPALALAQRAGTSPAAGVT
jgi:pyruvate kinase